MIQLRQLSRAQKMTAIVAFFGCLALAIIGLGDNPAGASPTGDASATISDISQDCYDVMNKVFDGYYEFSTPIGGFERCRNEYLAAFNPAIDWSIRNNYSYRGSIYNLVRDYPNSTDGKKSNLQRGWTAGVAFAAYVIWQKAFQNTLTDCLFAGPNPSEYYLVFKTKLSDADGYYTIDGFGIKRLSYWLMQMYVFGSEGAAYVKPNCFI